MKEEVGAPAAKTQKDCIAKGDMAGAQPATQASKELHAQPDRGFGFLKEHD